MSRDATSEDLPSTLERLSDRAVPGTERTNLGSWRLRAALGVTGRANSTWAPHMPTGSVADFVDEAVRWYGSRALTPRFQIYDHGEPEIVAELDRRRWPTTVDTLVMVADAVAVSASSRARRWPDGTSELTAWPTPSFVRLVDDHRRLTEVTTTSLAQRFVTMSGDGGLIGGGMATIDGSWAAVGAMNTRFESRRRGVASAVLATLAGAATRAGAEKMWLQVQSDNDGAVALYRGLGFEAVHRYRYRSAPDR